MTTTTVFKSNRSQAVRIPKNLAFPAEVKTVEVLKVGKSRVIIPSESLWDDWFNGESTSEDFMTDRCQPENQIREGF